MSIPSEWVWGELTDPAHYAHAEALAKLQLENARTMTLQSGRFAFTADQWVQHYRGALCEVFFAVWTGRPLQTVEEMASTWQGPDVDGYAIKGIGKPHYRLAFDEKDLAPKKYPPPTAFVLVLDARPRFAIVGRIDVALAREVRTWEPKFQYPAWVVEQKFLEPWHENDQELSVASPGVPVPTADDIRW